jgi:hypothetical protein
VVAPVVIGDTAYRELADIGVVDAVTLPAAPLSLNLVRIEFAPVSGVS